MLDLIEWGGLLYFCLIGISFGIGVCVIREWIYCVYVYCIVVKYVMLV